MAQARRFAGRGQVGGWQSSRHAWICQPCNRWFKKTPPKRKQQRICPGCEGAVLHFDSEPEAHRWQDLRQQLARGEISALEHHPRLPLVVPTPTGELVTLGHYEADSAYLDRGGALVWEDVKPVDPRAIDNYARRKIAHFEAQTGIKVRIVN